MLWVYVLVALLIGATIHSAIASRAGQTGRSVEQRRQQWKPRPLG